MGDSVWEFVLFVMVPASALGLLAPFALYTWFKLTLPKWRGTRDVAKARLVAVLAGDRDRTREGWRPVWAFRAVPLWSGAIRWQATHVRALRWRYAA
ncbi:MAG: hypothetical protein NDI84_08245 [Steroidobacteraceae bacterium]|nr:hypothetical protein [Steroidobacteraceae bacterium]